MLAYITFRAIQGVLLWFMWGACIVCITITGFFVMMGTFGIVRQLFQ